MKIALFNPAKTHLCHYSQQAKQTTVHIHLKQLGRLLNFDHNAFRTCLVLSGWEKMRWFVYFVFLAQTICKSKLEMSALLTRRCIKTNTVIQVTDIWVWAICRAVIWSSFLEKATSEWSVWGIRDYYCRERPAARIQHSVWLWEVDSLDRLRKGVGLQSSPTMMSSHVLIFHSFLPQS